MSSMLLKSLVAAFAFAQLTAVTTFASDLPKQNKVVVGINDAYIPSGFDSNADAYAVVSGLFPNGCYSWSHADVNHKTDVKIHEVKSVADVSEGLCIQVLVPFTKEVRLGKLSAGEHRIRFMSGDGTYVEKTVSIE